MDDTRQIKDANTVAGALRVLHILAAANHELARASGESALLQAVCEAAVTKGAYLAAWIRLAQYGRDKAVCPVARYGFEQAYLFSEPVTWADTERGQGPAGRAIRTGSTRVTRNVLTNPDVGSARKAAIERGFQSCIGLPLSRNRRAFGALLVLYFAIIDDVLERTARIATSFLAYRRLPSSVGDVASRQCIRRVDSRRPARVP